MLSYKSNFIMKVRSEPTVLQENKIGTMTKGGVAWGDYIYHILEDGKECKKGDQWLHVLKIVDEFGERNITGWMAIIHNGITLCSSANVPEVQYYQVRYDWEIMKTPRTKCPAIINPLNLEHNPISKKWLEFWRSLNSTGNPALDDKAFRTYANGKSFLMDGHGVESNDPRIENKVCAGNVVKILSEPAYGRLGKLWVEIETLDITQDPPQSMNYKTNPNLIQQATNYPGNNRCDPFPHLGGRDSGIPIYFPVTSKGKTFIEYKWLRKLPINQPLPNIYNPPMDY